MIKIQKSVTPRPKSVLTWPQIIFDQGNVRTPMGSTSGLPKNHFVALSKLWLAIFWPKFDHQAVHGSLFYLILTSFYRNRRSPTPRFSSWFCFWLCDHGWADWNHCWTMLANRDYPKVNGQGIMHWSATLYLESVTVKNTFHLSERMIFNLKTFHFWIF